MIVVPSRFEQVATIVTTRQQKSSRRISSRFGASHGASTAGILARVGRIDRSKFGSIDFGVANWCTLPIDVDKTINAPGFKIKLDVRVKMRLYFLSVDAKRICVVRGGA
jgi:hypothetical protein